MTVSNCDMIICLCVILSSIEIASSISVECDANTYQDDLSCTASCDLKNCGVISNTLNGSYLICTWNPYNSNDAKYDLSYYFQDTTNSKSCDATNNCSTPYSFSSSSGQCLNEMTLDECQYLELNTDTFSLANDIYVDNVYRCTTYFTQKICSIAVPEPPIVTNTQSAPPNIIVSVEDDPKCGDNTDIDYKIDYTITHGALASPQSGIIMRLTMPFVEASFYDFYVYANVQPTILSSVWSYPSHQTMITAPTTAVDNGKTMIFTCGDINGDLVPVTLKWQKTGYIDKFLIELVITSTNNVVSNLIQYGSNVTSQYSLFLDNFSTTSSYKVVILAQNSAGQSQSTTVTWDYTMCTINTYDIECSANSKGATWLDLSWEAMQDGQPITEGVYKISVTSDAYDTKGVVNASEENFNVTNLQQCVLYSVDLCYSKCTGCDTLACCTPTIMSYTEEMPPQTSPRFNVIATSSSTIQVTISDNNPRDDDCGFVTGYNVYYKPQYTSEYDIKYSETSLVNITNLKPYVIYDVIVTSINSAGEGKIDSDKSVRTNQAAPSDPPKITHATSTLNVTTVSWLPPTIPNGVISSYHLYFNISNANIKFDQQSSSNCMTSSDTVSCLYGGNITSAKLHWAHMDVIYIYACNGELCSQSSKAFVSVDDGSSNTDVLIGVIFLGIVLSLFCVTGIVIISYKWKKSAKESPRPWIPDNITQQIDHTYTNYDATKD